MSGESIDERDEIPSDEAEYGTMGLNIQVTDSAMVNRMVATFLSNLRSCVNGSNPRYLDGGRDLAVAFVELIASVTPDDLYQYCEERSWRGAIANDPKNALQAAWIVNAPDAQVRWYQDMVSSVVPAKAKKKPKAGESVYRPLNPIEWGWFIDRLFNDVREHAGELLR